MDESVADARRALDSAEALVTQRRTELADAITAAVMSGEMLSKVAKAAGYEREHVRRIVRARGVEPRQIKTPPPVRSRKSP